MKTLSKKSSLCLAISCIIATVPCYAETLNSQNPILITDGSTYNIEDNSIISVPSASSENPAIFIGSPYGGTVNGETLKIETDGIGIRIHLYYNFQTTQGDGIINLGTTEINSKGISIQADTYNYTHKAEVHLGDNSKITSSDSVAINAHRNALVTIGNKAEIQGNTYGPTVAVISATAGGKIEIGDNVKITQTGGQTENGANRIAVFAYNSDLYDPANDDFGDPFDNIYKGYIKIGDNSEIKSLGSSSGSSAVVAGWVFSNNVLYGGNISIGKNANISTAGTNSHAIWSRHEDSKIEIGSDSKISTIGDGSHAVQAGIAISSSNYVSGGTIDIAEKSNIITTGKAAYGLYALATDSIINLGDSSSISTAGENAYGVNATRGGIVNLTNVNITTEGKNSIGLYAGNGLSSSVTEKGIININDGITIITSGENAHGIQVSKSGEVNLDGNVNIAVDSSKNAYALAANGQGIISGKALYNIYGDINATSLGQINLELAETSVFNGSTSLTGNSTISLDMTKSSWNVTDNSTITNLKLNNSVIDLQNAQLGTTLNIKNLTTTAPADQTTNGFFILKTDIVDGVGDKIITETTYGYHILSILNQGSSETTGTETLVVAETGDGNGDFKLQNDNVEIGAWLYGLRRAEDNQNNWELYGTGSGPVPSAAINTFMASYLLSYAETQTLLQRLGDLRDTPHLAGFWFRAYGGKMESNSRSFVRGFDLDYAGAQMGYDRKIKNNSRGATYIGGMFGYSKGNLNYSMEKSGTGGSGKIDSKTFGIYTTHIQNNGFYADALLKYMWMKNKFDVLDTVGDIVTGDNVNTGGLGFSLELGKRFKFNQNEQGNVWYIEPQIQYSYTHQDGGNFHASNELKIGVDSFTSSLGRVGLRIGYETKKTNIYAKASYVKEFDGDVKIIANNVEIPESFGDNWWVYGVGFTSQINERNNIYMSIERAQGGKFTEPWKIYAGWRISF